MIALLIVQAFLSIPNLVFGERNWVYGFAPIVFLIGVAYSACVAFVLRKALVREVREKMADLAGTMQGFRNSKKNQ